MSHTLIGFGLNDDRDYTVHKASTHILWVVSQTRFSHLSEVSTADAFHSDQELTLNWLLG